MCSKVELIWSLLYSKETMKVWLDNCCFCQQDVLDNEDFIKLTKFDPNKKTTREKLIHNFCFEQFFNTGVDKIFK